MHDSSGQSSIQTLAQQKIILTSSLRADRLRSVKSLVPLIPTYLPLGNVQKGSVVRSACKKAAYFECIYTYIYTHSNSMFCLYFYYFLRCRLISLTSKPLINILVIMQQTKMFNKQEYILDFRFFKVATFCFEDSFAHSWHCLTQRYEVVTWNSFPTVLKEFPEALSTCCLIFLNSAVQLIANYLKSVQVGGCWR